MVPGIFCSNHQKITVWYSYSLKKIKSHVISINMSFLHLLLKSWPPLKTTQITHMCSVRSHCIIVIKTELYIAFSGVASIGQRGQSAPPLDSQKIVKNREKGGEIGKKRGKIEKNREKEENRKERAKIGKVFALCPSWQIGLTTLLIALQPGLDEHTFLISTKKESKYMAINPMHLLFSVSPFTVPSNTCLRGDNCMLLAHRP